MDLDRVLSRGILGQVIFGATVTAWLEHTIPILIALALGQTITLVMLISWAAWGVASLLALLLLLYWSYLESSTNSIVNYVTEEPTDDE